MLRLLTDIEGRRRFIDMGLCMTCTSGLHTYDICGSKSRNTPVKSMYDHRAFTAYNLLHTHNIHNKYGLLILHSVYL
jgi:hypothetical protein